MSRVAVTRGDLRGIVYFGWDIGHNINAREALAGKTLGLSGWSHLGRCRSGVTGALLTKSR